MKLTNEQITKLSDAITFLDGQHVMQVVEGKAVGIFKSFRIHATARWNFAVIQGKLHAIIADFNRAKDALIKHHTEGKSEIAQNHPKFAAFVDDLEKLKTQPVELAADPIPVADLKMEENQTHGTEYPISVLTALAPLLVK